MRATSSKWHFTRGLYIKLHGPPHQPICGMRVAASAHRDPFTPCPRDVTTAHSIDTDLYLCTYEEGIDI